MSHDELITLCNRFLKAWHENQRARHERDFPNTNYDGANAKRLAERRDWICLDSGSSGYYMVRKADGQVFQIKAYGRPNLKRPCGYIGDIVMRLELANVDGTEVPCVKFAEADPRA